MTENKNSYQDMARRALRVFEEAQSESSSGRMPHTQNHASSSSVQSRDSVDATVHYVTKERYDSLKAKYTASARELSSRGVTVPDSVLERHEKIKRLYESMNNKIASGTVKIVSSSNSDRASHPSNLAYHTHNTNNSSNRVPNVVPGSQMFSEMNKHNYSFKNTRTGDGHSKPVGTPFQASPLSKYDKLKIYHSHNYLEPAERAAQHILGASLSALAYSARSEQSGTADMMVSAEQRSRDIVNTIKVLNQTPRNIQAAYYTGKHAAVSARNVARFFEGNEAFVHTTHKPLTIKQIERELRNPFGDNEKPVIDKKFGSKTHLKASELDRRVVIKTAQNKGLKQEINDLQSRYSSLTVDEKKHLRELMEKKKGNDADLRKLHGLKQARRNASERNREADRTNKNSAKKTIKKTDKNKLRLSKGDKGVYGHIKNRKDLLEQHGRLLKAKEARKQLTASLTTLIAKPASEGEDSTIQSILTADRVLQNRHVRAILKTTTKGALLPVKVAAKTAKLSYKGARALDNKFNQGRIGSGIDRGTDAVKSVNRAVRRLGENSVKTVVNSRVYRELNGGIYQRARKRVASVVPQKIKTKVNKGAKTVNSINSKRKLVLAKFKSFKNQIAASKLGRFVAATSKGARGLANAFKFAKKIFIKVGLYAACLLIVVSMIGAAITAAGGVVSSFVFGEEDDNGNLSLASYVKTYNAAEKDFLDGINSMAASLESAYDNVFVNYQSGTMTNNFKEIISMAAVYFDQDIGPSNKDAVNDYINRLYNDSHYYTKVESEPYFCSGCEDRDYHCTDEYDKFATGTRKSLYNKYAERGGCIGEYYSCDGCVENVVEYKCENRDCRVRFHNDGNAMSSPGNCSDYNMIYTIDGDKAYYCEGHTYCGGHTKIVMTCPGTHIEYHCDGHTETICRGEHVDLDINVMVLGFDEIFHADSTVNSSIAGVDTSTGNVTKGAEIGTFTVTYYCTERYPHICNAGPPYKTASGTEVTPGRTIAVDKSLIPLGTHVVINGHEYIAEDTGGAIKGYRIDIAVATHAEALQSGKKTFKVYYAEAVDDDSGNGAGTRLLSIPYLDYAKEAASDAISQTFVLQAFGQAKEPEVVWKYNRVNYDTAESFVKKLRSYDKDHEKEPFSNAEINTFEYVNMSKAKLEKLAKQRTGKDHSKKSVYNIIVDVLIPYDKEHPDEFVSKSEAGGSFEYYFEGWTKDNIDWVKDIYQNINSENYVGLEGLHHYTSDDVSFEGVVLKQGETEVVYYNQYDIRWKNLPYSTSTIGKSGCAPTSMAMVVSTLSGTTVDPLQMSNWAAKNGYYVNGVGTSWSFVSAAASNWGLSCSDMGKGNVSAVVSALSNGKLVVMSTGSGAYYSGKGHFLVLRGVDENGKILVADPASKDKSERAWPLQDIMSGLKNWWIIGK